MTSKKAVAEKTKEIVPQKSAALIMNQGPRRGFEAGTDQEDLIIPRAKLIQALSPEMTDRELKKQFPGLTIGSIINSLTSEPIGEEFVPIFMFKNYIRFNPRSKEDANFDSKFEPGAIIWRSNDPLDPRVQAETKFGPNGEKPAATTFMNFFCYFPDSTTPIIVSFSKTSYGAGKKLLSLARFAGGDMFSHKYRLTSDQETNDIATYAVLRVQAAGPVDTADYPICEQLWGDFAEKAKDIKVHDQDKAEGSEETTDDGRPY
jgi:hypothetical protein